MKTPQEIAQYIRMNNDMFGFVAESLVPYLPFANAREFLIPEATESEWEQLPLTRDVVVGAMREYTAFAWEKALNHRGISANRSVMKLKAWIFALGDEPVTDRYTNYGAPVLLAVCERYHFPIPDDDAAARMARGESCRAGCDEGCGR